MESSLHSPARSSFAKLSAVDDDVVGGVGGGGLVLLRVGNGSLKAVDDEKV